MNTIKTAPYAAVAANVSNGVATVRMLIMIVNPIIKTVMTVRRLCMPDWAVDIYCKTQRGPTSIARPSSIVVHVTHLLMIESRV